MIFTGHQRSPEATKIDTAYDFPTVFYLHGCAVFYIGQITLFYTKPVSKAYDPSRGDPSELLSDVCEICYFAICNQ